MFVCSKCGQSTPNKPEATQSGTSSDLKRDRSPKDDKAWVALSDDVKTKIQEDYSYGLPLTIISTRYNIPYNFLTRFKKKGFINLNRN